MPKFAISNVIERTNWPLSMPFWIVWHAFASLFLLVAAALSLDQPFSLSADKIQVLLLVVGYFGLSLLIIPATARSPYTLLAQLVPAAAIGFGGLCILLRFADLPASPWVIGAGGAAAAVFAIVPYLSLKARMAAIGLVVAGGIVFVAVQRLGPETAVSGKRSITTALYSVNVETHAGLIEQPASDGGAMESHRRGVILATGDGKFYWISKTHEGLRASALAIPDPTNRKAYLSDFGDSKPPRLRLTDVVFDRSPDPQFLYAAHQSWNSKGRCYAHRISVIPLSWPGGGGPRSDGQWRALFESKPCIKAEGTFDDSESGGRLAWAKDGGLLLTLGDLGFAGLDGNPPVSQDPGVDYGKILKVDPRTGRSSVVSIGHRNPQGLLVRADGQIWETEHGPQGGDEINLIAEGGNYGWPLATYGTEYGTNNWPLNPDGHDHGEFREPAIAFMPAVALSAMIEVRGREFPHWNGDLLASSLRTEALFRARVRGDRVIYVESFSMGHRIRDLVQTADGRILIWSDTTATLLELSRGEQEDAYTRYCAGCHNPKFGAAAGPILDDVVGRQIASAPGFTYSAGLKKRKGIWSETELDAFLRDPETYAPGTTMKLHGLDDKSRAKVIEQLVQKSN